MNTKPFEKEKRRYLRARSALMGRILKYAELKLGALKLADVMVAELSLIHRKQADAMMRRGGLSLRGLTEAMQSFGESAATIAHAFDISVDTLLENEQYLEVIDDEPQTVSDEDVAEIMARQLEEEE